MEEKQKALSGIGIIKTFHFVSSVERVLTDSVDEHKKIESLFDVMIN